MATDKTGAAGDQIGFAGHDSSLPVLLYLREGVACPHLMQTLESRTCVSGIGSCRPSSSSQDSGPHGAGHVVAHLQGLRFAVGIPIWMGPEGWCPDWFRAY